MRAGALEARSVRHREMSKKEETVRVVVRCRPLNSKERGDGREKIVQMDSKRGTVTLQALGSNEPPKTFTFDQVYDDTTDQAVLYEQTASRIVDSVLEGFNGTIFAYGQTGSGKTYTMEGRDARQANVSSPRVVSED